MTANLQWPTYILAPRKVMVDPTYATMSGGRSITGIEQIVATDAGFWSIQLDEIPFMTPLQKQTARALSAQLEGRLNTIDVPIYDWQSAPFPTLYANPHGKQGNIPFQDGTPFADRAGFQMGTIVATISGAVALGATALIVHVAVGSALQPGQHFSVLGAQLNRLYRIKTVGNVVAGNYSLTVWPPVREAMSNGNTAEFNDPRCSCRLKSDTEMMSFVDDYAGRTLASVAFEEQLP